MIIKIINKISAFIGNILLYKNVYKITGIFFTRKFKKAKCNHKYAILVAARNEETVIGNLLDRIINNYVVDFFYFCLINFPIFNVADIYVTVAAFMFIILGLFYYKEDDFSVIFPDRKHDGKHEN